MAKLIIEAFGCWLDAKFDSLILISTENSGKSVYFAVTIKYQTVAISQYLSGKIGALNLLILSSVSSQTYVLVQKRTENRDPFLTVNCEL